MTESNLTDHDEVRSAVREKYGRAALTVLDGGSAASCCGSKPSSSSSCCGTVEPEAATTSCCQADAAVDIITGNLYSSDQAAELPAEALLASLGCGNPTALATLSEGEVVLDLGSGGGIDVLLSARRVGPSGFVYGLDMTDEMLALAEKNRATAGAENVRFLKGHIEEIPLADNTVDVIISNCVINLVPDKAQVFREAFRVLKPGGRLAVSDVVNIAPLPEDLRADPVLLCGCVAGAAPADRVEILLRAAGFVDVAVTVKPDSREMVASWAPGRGIEKCVASAMVEARKPRAGEESACCASGCCA